MRILALSESLTPITHQLGTVGNESIVNTEDVATPLGIRSVPMLSGNALRHRMLRVNAADAVVEACGLQGALTRDQLNILYHGGLKRVAGKAPSLKRIEAFQRLVPVVGLLGACLPEAIVRGKAKVWRAILVCRENASRIAQLSGVEGLDMDRMPPASHYVSRWQYVRGKLDHDIAASAIDVDDSDPDTMMPFSGTCVVPGALWFHGFDLPNDLILLGCFFDAVGRWDAVDSTIGGQSSRGHGKLQVSLMSEEITGGAIKDAVVAYHKHLEDNAAEAKELIESC